MAIPRKMTDEKEGELREIKDIITATREYWRDNLTIYREFTYMVFKTSLTEDAKSSLKALSKPAVEFNILEAMISRLRSEFAKQEPSLYVRAADGVPMGMITPEFEAQMEAVEGYIREMLLTSKNDNLQYNLFYDCLAGGYSAAKVTVDYTDPMSFEYKINVEKVFDSKLVGFDPLARNSTKSDGEYCFEIYPMRKEDFDKRFGKDVSAQMKYSRTAAGFTWSYKSEREEKIILVCEFFRKRKKKMTIAKLTNGHVINAKHYDAIINDWNLQGFIEQAPQVVEERSTEIEFIDRYLICENKILEHNETDYAFLPIVFFDGNSQMIQDGEEGPTYQMVRPFPYHARGIQLVKNLAGQTIAAEMQNMVQHKFMIPVEGIPTAPQHQNAYKNVQIADTFVYNAYDPEDPTKAIPPPREIQRTVMPPIVEETFTGADNATQMILGSYDTVLGTNSNQLSGKAIQAGALQSNGAAMPYLINHIKGLNQIAQIVLDLIPKYMVTPRTIPVKKANGKRDYQVINQKGNGESINMNYKPSTMNINIEAGVNSSIAKEAALDTITKLMASSPGFANFIDTMGLPVLVDNIDIRGSDHLKVLAEQYMQMLEEQKKQPPPPTEAQILADAEKEIELTRINVAKQKNDGEIAVQTAKVSVEKQNADTKFLELMINVEQKAKQADIQKARDDAMNAKDAIEVALKIAEGMGKRRGKE